jgi:hypothetical protein
MKTFKEFIKESEHPMIDVDGVLRHRNNSEGNPIHPTEDGIRAFHRWFGKSKNVDEHGRPQVLYHGTSSNIPKFDTSYTGKGTDQQGSGFYLTNNPELASHYSTASSDYEYTGKAEKTPNVIPAYVSVKKPIDVNSEKPLTRAHIIKLIQSAPNHEETLGDNWGHIPSEGYHRVLKSAVDSYSSIPAYHAMNSMSNDFYKKHPEHFLNSFKKVTGHDGVITDNQNGTKIISAFTPNQIKSSTGNKGTFHKKKDEITEKSI